MGNSLNNLDPSKIDIEKEQLDISNVMLNSSIIFNRDGKLTTSDFNLYIWRAFNANDYDAIEKFTNKFIHKIPKDSIEYCSNISRAYLLFGKEKFNETLEIISNSEHPNFITRVRMKHLKAKFLYELNEYNSFESEFKSMYHFLKNNKFLSSKIKADTKDVFDKINRMFKLKENFDLYEFDKLKKETSISSINKTSWLNRKIIELEIKN